VCEGDHKWFEANPNRKHRLRPVIAGEYIAALEPGRFHYCIVTRIGPGVRARRFVHFCAPVDRELSEHEIGKLGSWASDPTKPFPFTAEGVLKA
jgi:hypothetical protein